MSNLYRKKPVVIEARKYTRRNFREIFDFIGGCAYVREIGGNLIVETSEENITALPGDWIIKGVKGELYTCKPDIFAATYEPVAERSK